MKACLKPDTLPDIDFGNAVEVEEMYIEGVEDGFDGSTFEVLSPDADAKA